MSDILGKLRGWSANPERKLGAASFVAGAMMLEAADEIERLQGLRTTDTACHAANNDGIIWGLSMRSYVAENKARIRRIEKSLVSLKNQTGQYAEDHRKLLAFYHEVNDVLSKHYDECEKS